MRLLCARLLLRPVGFPWCSSWRGGPVVLRLRYRVQPCRRSGSSPSPGSARASPVSFDLADQGVSASFRGLSGGSGRCAWPSAWRFRASRGQVSDEAVESRHVGCGLPRCGAQLPGHRQLFSHSRKKSRDRGSRNMNRARFSGSLRAEDAFVEGKAEAVGGDDVHA